MTTTRPLQKFDMEPEDIDRLVAAFYKKVRAEPTLGPVFAQAIAPEDGPEWRAHEAKIASFWRNVIGIDRSYSGNPTAAHVSNPRVMPGMFSVWLDLFEETAHEVLSPEKAAPISALARRIGDGMRYAVTNRNQPRGAPPVLMSGGLP